MVVREDLPADGDDKLHLRDLPTLYDCVHCGLCLPACPTYEVTGRESQSPRGRIAAFRGLAAGRIQPTRDLRMGLEDCLVCRACESVCPSGISMEKMMGGYRERARRLRTDLPTRLERFLLRHVIPSPGALEAATALLRAVAPLARRLPAGRDLPTPARLRAPPPLRVDPPTGTPRGTVGLFRGCIGDRWFRRETLAAASVLARNGWRVVVPAATCCGALHRHGGLLPEAAAHSEATARALCAAEEPGGKLPDHIAVDSAGCAAALADPLPGASAAVAAMAERVIDTPGLLAASGWDPPTRKLTGNWVVAPACHHRNGPLAEDGLREVLDRVLPDGYRELPPPEHCCGAAGFFVLRRRAMSRRVGGRALERFRASGATGIVNANPGCLLRWEALLRGEPEAEVIHPVVAVERAYRL